MNTISVIIPTRDRYDDLSACLYALSMQKETGSLLEIIVVDDHSTDTRDRDLQQIAANLELPLIFKMNGVERGSATARNLAVSHAKGEIIAFLDDDAIPAPDWLKVIEESLNYPGTAAITGRILPSDGHKVFSRARQLRYELRQREYITGNTPVQAIAGGNAAMWRSAFEEIGGFDTRFEVMHDRELALRLTDGGKVCRYEHRLVIAHRNHKSIRSAYYQAFLSAYYRHQLETLHKTVPKWSLVQHVKIFRRLISAGCTDFQWFLPSLIACTTECVHLCGCIWYRPVSD